MAGLDNPKRDEMTPEPARSLLVKIKTLTAKLRGSAGISH